jgi:hypothetical protein
MVTRTRHNIMNILMLQIFFKLCVHIGYLNKITVMQFRQYTFWRNRIADLYILVLIVPRLSTANRVSEEKFNFWPTAPLRPTARTSHLSIAFSAYNVQQAKYNRLCLSGQQTEIFGVASQTCCAHYKTDLTILYVFQKPSLHKRRDNKPCHRRWLPALSISSVQMSVSMVSFGRSLVIGLPWKPIEAVSCHRQKNTSATQLWRAKNCVGLV